MGIRLQFEAMALVLKTFKNEFGCAWNKNIEVKMHGQFVIDELKPKFLDRTCFGAAWLNGNQSTVSADQLSGKRILKRLFKYIIGDGHCDGKAHEVEGKVFVLIDVNDAIRIIEGSTQVNFDGTKL